MNPVIDAVLAGVVAPLGAQGKYSAIHKVPVPVRVHVGDTGKVESWAMRLNTPEGAK